MNAPSTEPVEGAPEDGVDATTGGYLHPALDAEALAALAATTARRGPRAREAAEAGAWLQKTRGPRLGPRAGIDPKDLAATGWAAVFPRDADPAVRAALAPLLSLRREQAAARRETWYRELAGEEGYLPGDTKASFLNRRGAGGAGPADPRELPYYLLLVGRPEEIPFEFQHQLDVQYAVGRLGFDTAEEYARYAEGVVAAERRAPTGEAPRAVLFAAKNPDDLATARMADHLAGPLARALAEGRPEGTVESVVGDDATKARLARLLGGEETPALLFTATHGMGFPAGDPRQRERQGALLCQDWPGPKAAAGPIAEDCYFHAADLPQAARLSGLVSFHFACHSGGTPSLAGYGEPRPLAPADFLARLPGRLLGHGNGGALAAVGHVERTWGHSFLWQGAQTEVFEDALGLILDGWPVGAALEAFGQRYAALATELVEEQRRGRLGKRTDPALLARLFTAVEDARNHLLLGDPAVRIRL